MSKPKLTLNIRNPTNRKSSDSLAKAAEKKRSNIETMDEAWARIFDMKNSAADERRLREVKQAMDEGLIGRDPDDMYNARGNLKRFSKAEALRLWSVLDAMKAEERLRELVENMPDNYHLITDEKEFDKMLGTLSFEDTIVFDVETTGTDVYSDKIVGHVLSATSVDEHYYIPTNHDDNQAQLDRDYVAEELRPIYEADSIKFIAHNAK